MILVITTREHGYTHEALRKQRDLDVVVVSYDEILRRKWPYRATHVFTDADRLPAWRVHEAALLYRSLRRGGINALNDPAQMLGRFGLLRALNRAGINQFDVYRADGLEVPRRWPVFLRLEGNHLAPLTGLLHSKEELGDAVEECVRQGAPRSAMLIIEYAAESVRPGIFRKLSVFRVADRLLGYTCVHDDNWLVKYGKPAIAPAELYDEEYSFVRDNPYGPIMRRVFEIAGIDYGRVDFGLVGGQPQVYEVNSNPHLDFRPKPGRAARRDLTMALFRANYVEAMNAIDTFHRSVWQVRASALLRAARTSPRRALGAARKLKKTAGTGVSPGTSDALSPSA